MPVPLFFAGAPSAKDGKFDLDSQHKGLSVAYRASPYDWGVALSSAESLLLARARLVRQPDWVAVDLQVYNVYGPPLEAPPPPLARGEGGEQLADLPVERADKIIPGDLTVGECEATSSAQDAHGGPSLKLGSFDFGLNCGYSWGHDRGAAKAKAVIHPLRWELITRSWSASQLKETAATIVLLTPYHKEFAHFDYKGIPPKGAEASVPGSAAEEGRYRYALYGQAGESP